MVAVSDQLSHDPTALDWSPNGKFIVLGDRNGVMKSLDATTLKVIDTFDSALANKSSAWVEDIKVSPDCKYVAFGTHGGLSKIDIAKIDDSGMLIKYSSCGTLMLSSALISLDWTLDSENVIVNSQAAELKWLNVTSKTQVFASSAKNFEYQSWSCRFGWPVQGIWPGKDYT